MKEKFRQFMVGRYGVDEFAKFLSGVILGFLILNLFIRNDILFALAVLVMVWSYVRMFSKNYSKRYDENRKYLELQGRVQSWLRREQRMAGQRKEFHIYTCPGCRQKIRIPRGKGKIVVTCPKCRGEFTKRS